MNLFFFLLDLMNSFSFLFSFMNFFSLFVCQSDSDIVLLGLGLSASKAQDF